MERTEDLRRSVESAEDAFQQSLVRLSNHLTARRSIPLLAAPLPAPKPRLRGWPVAALVAAAGAAVVGYHYSAFSDGNPPIAQPHATEAVAAPSPVPPSPAALAVVPDPAAAPVPAKDEKKMASVEEAAAALPPPPPEDSGPIVAPVAPPPEATLSWTEVLELQKRLAAVGADPGPLDGIAGPRTVGGVRRYEEQHGRVVTGKVDRAMLKVLQQDSASSAALEASAP
jgi:Putative peptidoglycan binding domain